MQLTPNSRGLLQLLDCYKRTAFELCKVPLLDAKKVSTLTAGCGFGEVATLTNTRLLSSFVAITTPVDQLEANDNATVSTAATDNTDLFAHNSEFIVVPRDAFSDLVGSGDGHVNYEAVDFLRQSGLGTLVSVNEMVEMAESMTKKLVKEGDCLFALGTRVESVYFVVSGEVLLLVNDNHRADHDIVWDMKKLSRFIVSTESSCCYSLGVGSFLGNESLYGSDRRHMATALVASETASVFEVRGSGVEYLAKKLEMDRFTALSYRDISRWDPSIKSAENKSMQTFFDTLQRAMTRRNAYRGVRRPADVVPLDMSTQEQRLSPSHKKSHTLNKSSNVDTTKKENDGSCVVDVHEGVDVSHSPKSKKVDRSRPNTPSAVAKITYPCEMSLLVKHYVHTLSRQVRAFEMNARGVLTEAAKVSC